MSKPIIAIDIDDVLSTTVEQLLALSNEHFGTRFRADDFQEPYSKMWGVDETEADRRLAILDGVGFMRTTSAIEGAAEALKRMKDQYELHILTSRGQTVAQKTHVWLDQHFPNTFSKIQLISVYDNGDHDAARRVTKANICTTIGADYLIDDQPKHANAVARCGTKALLFGDYPWNRDAEIVDGVVRVKDWRAVAEYFGV